MVKIKKRIAFTHNMEFFAQYYEIMDRENETPMHQLKLWAVVKLKGEKDSKTYEVNSIAYDMKNIPFNYCLGNLFNQISSDGIEFDDVEIRRQINETHNKML